jgi:CheY-like chemotaxis protein
MTNRDRRRAFDDPIPLPGGRKLITLRQRGSQLRAASNEDPAVREAALNSGCIALLTKPFSSQEPIETLKKAARP